MADDLVDGLAAVLGAAEVTGLTKLSGGASRDTWRFEADGRPLILQRRRRGDMRDSAVEIGAVRAAALAGVPTAAIVAASAEPADLGAAYMILTRVVGETTPRKILRDDTFQRARTLLPVQLAAVLARIHSIEPATIPGLADTDQVQQYRQSLDELGQPHPAFELALRWLDAHRPPATGRVVVHGDFRLGNFIVGDEGLRAVLDWELVHLGDPMEDLGWMCVKSWRFGSPLPAAGLAEYDQLFRAYEAAGGRAVDAATVHWWEVLGTLKWGIMCIAQANAHLTGATRSHELAAVGRRVCETEHDLFLALEGRW
ncbi:MAG: phosphotransferase family protein [Ilumatobacteraceae bacterium]